MGIRLSKNAREDGDRILVAGKPDYNRCDNMITTAKYTVWTFLPIAIGEQFRRFANMYFLFVGMIMAVGTYSNLFQSAISPWTTLGPLAFVISVSLLVEGLADAKRHRSDNETNNAPCVILRRSDQINSDEHAERDKSIMNGKDVIVNISTPYFQTSNNQAPETPVSKTKQDTVGVGFQKIRRMDIRQGHFVFVKNREMVPADMILLASSGDNGSAYIETSSIDGETNLKLRTSPHLPKKLLKHLRDGTPMETIEDAPEEDGPSKIETLEQATKRVTRFSALAYPDGTSALENPTYKNKMGLETTESKRSFFTSGLNMMKESVQGVRSPLGAFHSDHNVTSNDGETHYIAALTSEPPNAHVNTFSGKLTLPPVELSGGCHDIPLGAENILLRGAVVRNTEWVIGLACFTGTDTKLVQNSFETPSKFSQLDILMNQTVAYIIIIMVLCISYLSSQAVISNDQEFQNLWYIGLTSDTTAKWPYLPQELEAPEWTTTTPNWLQMFFLYVTLLSNFVPLSMYVTVEAINFFFLYLIYVDLDLYDDRTDTRGLARSTNVTDLGQVQYVFSDKTGTLTQNVMRFKRCSVDGMIFGAPIQKSRPGGEDFGMPPSSFHPVRHLLVGRVGAKQGQEGYKKLQAFDGKLTFNSEMFLRVLSLCHTVVVEKDLDLKPYIDSAKSVESQSSNWSAKKYAKKFFGKRDRTVSEMSGNSANNQLDAVMEEADARSLQEGKRSRAGSNASMTASLEKAADGAPGGFAYQAESPDEGALVSAASNAFGFQVIGRDSSGIKLRCAHPTILSDENIIKGIKGGQISTKKLAAQSAAGVSNSSSSSMAEVERSLGDPQVQRIETWSILAVNKFDSDRKRMSILLRSPPELGNIVMLLCKGADSAMLDPSVCSGGEHLVSGHGDDTFTASQRLDSVAEDSEENREQDEWETAQMLGIQSHLGEFASEGLRTLVLGVRFLTEKECERWLEMYKTAATSIKNRDQMLTAAAYEVERNIHIVGATAIEDKLQNGVPDTIATLAKAGVKLWVLTGDKRETAIEIGYATHVLTPKMHLTEVSDRGLDFVRAQCAMEFMRLVKAGKLPGYQRAEVDQPDDGFTWENVSFAMGKCTRAISRSFRKFFVKMLLFLSKMLGADPVELEEKAQIIEQEESAEKDLLKDIVRRRNVRNRAEKIIREFLDSPEGQMQKARKGSAHSPRSDDSEDVSLSSDDVPSVFNRAQSARSLLEKKRSEGKLYASENRNDSLAQLTAQEVEDSSPSAPLIEEDTLSLNSFLPTSGDAISDFDKRRRTVLERLFAVDRDVRKGRLVKHLKKERRLEALSSPQSQQAVGPSGDGPRSLVIEGAALKHLLGDTELEELIFSIASVCETVIACRVSPRQKALLVKLVRHHVVPEPVTLAIGDGANDVGMIQEAHVGVGISGKEGKQAVNASDFAIAQFRFLETLVLIHGRWDFFRLSTVVLFSFYKNAVMAGCLIVFNGETLFSGTPLFDEWIIAVLNFVAGLPIMVIGLFDRCLSKDYVRRNPEVFQPTRQNELITLRVLIRWVICTFGHVFILYFGTIPQLASGGGMTSAFVGLMKDVDKSHPGEGEGGDLLSVGTVTFTCMIILLAYKVLYESRSLIHGRWPAFIYKKGAKDGFFSRLGYTWIGVGYCSIIFYIMFLFIYDKIGVRRGPGEYFNLVGFTPHLMGSRSINWLAILFIPIVAISFDLAGKVFSNIFYPTQTQIHVEIESKERALRRKRRKMGEHVPHPNIPPSRQV